MLPPSFFVSQARRAAAATMFLVIWRCTLHCEQRAHQAQWDHHNGARAHPTRPQRPTTRPPAGPNINININLKLKLKLKMA